jgi:hypothetical protein
MSDALPTVVEMLHRRLQIVQEISAAQARNVRNRQMGGGAEFEVQRIEQEIAAGCSQALSSALEDARERLQRANAEIEACEAHCAGLEQCLEELDRRIAAGV